MVGEPILIELGAGGCLTAFTEAMRVALGDIWDRTARTGPDRRSSGGGWHAQTFGPGPSSISGGEGTGGRAGP